MSSNKIQTIQLKRQLAKGIQQHVQEFTNNNCPIDDLSNWEIDANSGEMEPRRPFVNASLEALNAALSELSLSDASIVDYQSSLCYVGAIVISGGKYYLVAANVDLEAGTLRPHENTDVTDPQCGKYEYGTSLNTDIKIIIYKESVRFYPQDYSDVVMWIRRPGLEQPREYKYIWSTNQVSLQNDLEQIELPSLAWAYDEHICNQTNLADGYAAGWHYRLTRELSELGICRAWEPEIFESPYSTGRPFMRIWRNAVANADWNEGEFWDKIFPSAIIHDGMSSHTINYTNKKDDSFLDLGHEGNYIGRSLHRYIPADDKHRTVTVTVDYQNVNKIWDGGTNQYKPRELVASVYRGRYAYNFNTGRWEDRGEDAMPHEAGNQDEDGWSHPFRFHFTNTWWPVFPEGDSIQHNVKRSFRFPMDPDMATDYPAYEIMLYWNTPGEGPFLDWVVYNDIDYLICPFDAHRWYLLGRPDQLNSDNGNVDYYKEDNDGIAIYGITIDGLDETEIAGKTKEIGGNIQAGFKSLQNVTETQVSLASTHIGERRFHLSLHEIIAHHNATEGSNLIGDTYFIHYTLPDTHEYNCRNNWPVKNYGRYYPLFPFLKSDTYFDEVTAELLSHIAFFDIGISYLYDGYQETPLYTGIVYQNEFAENADADAPVIKNEENEEPGVSRTEPSLRGLNYFGSDTPIFEQFFGTNIVFKTENIDALREHEADSTHSHTCFLVNIPGQKRRQVRLYRPVDTCREPNNMMMKTITIPIAEKVDGAWQYLHNERATELRVYFKVGLDSDYLLAKSFAIRSTTNNDYRIGPHYVDLSHGEPKVGKKNTPPEPVDTLFADDVNIPPANGGFIYNDVLYIAMTTNVGNISSVDYTASSGLVPYEPGLVTGKNHAVLGAGIVMSDPCYQYNGGLQTDKNKIVSSALQEMVPSIDFISMGSSFKIDESQFDDIRDLITANGNIHIFFENGFAVYSGQNGALISNNVVDILSNAIQFRQSVYVLTSEGLCLIAPTGQHEYLGKGIHKVWHGTARDRFKLSYDIEDVSVIMLDTETSDAYAVRVFANMHMPVVQWRRFTAGEGNAKMVDVCKPMGDMKTYYQTDSHEWFELCNDSFTTEERRVVFGPFVATGDYKNLLKRIILFGDCPDDEESYIEITVFSYGQVIDKKVIRYFNHRATVVLANHPSGDCELELKVFGQARLLDATLEKEIIFGG